MTWISRGVAGHHLVDRVVDDLAHQVVQAADVAVADVHAGPLADVLQVAHVAHLGAFVFALAVGDLGRRQSLGSMDMGLVLTDAAIMQFDQAHCVVRDAVATMHSHSITRLLPSGSVSL